jgi:acetylornithine deacetylase
MSDATETLRRLVAYPTVSNRPLIALAADLAERHEAWGFRVERFESDEPGKVNLVCSAGPQTGDGLVLSGHMDVVPTEGQPWSTDPFEVTLRGGRLYGRGTADMKGFIAATLRALDRIAPSDLRRELVVVWTHDEEVGCLGSAQLTHRLEQAGRTLPAACLIGEPTDFRILRMHPGHVGMEIEITGRAAHSSRPDLGANAIEGAAEAVSIIRRIAAQLSGERAHEDLLERPWVAVNVANISGGDAINIVPDSCRLQVGYRPLPGSAPDAVFHRIRQALEAHFAQRSTPIQARLLRVTPSLLTPEGTSLQATLAAHAATQQTGAASFATDGGNLARLGCQPLIFGPGSIEVAHKADEFIEQAALHQAVDVIEAVIRTRCC